MNIFYISASRVPSRAANSIHVMKMCAAFAKNGHTTYLLTAKVKNDIEKGIKNIFNFYDVPSNFKLYRLPWLPIKNFAFIYGLQILVLFCWTIVRKCEIPLCYGRFLLGLYLVSFLGPKLIIEMHAPVGIQKSEQFMFDRIIRKKNFEKLVVISSNLERHFLEKYPSLKNRVLVAHDGADITLSTTISNNIFPKDRIHVGYVGHLYRGRGIQTIVDISRALPNIQLHLIGGTDEDIKYWTQQTSGDKNIKVHGFLSPQKAAEYRSRFDILLAPYERKVSIYGSSMNTVEWMSPLKIFEYMSAKKPIVASDLPAVREILKHNQTSILCNPEDSTEWVRAIQELISNPDLAEKISENAYNEFLKKYTWEERAKNVLVSII